MKPGTLTFGTILAGVAALLALWPQAQPVLDWALLNLGVVVLHPQTHAIVAGVLIGGGLAWRVAYELPTYFTPPETKQRLRWYASMLTFALSWYLSPLQWPWGAVWALVAALFGQWLLIAVARIVYAVVPQSKPESLK